MRLSEEKLEKIAEDLSEMLEDRGDLVRVSNTGTNLERDLLRFLIDDFKIEDEIHQEALARMETYSKQVASGTTEWTILLEKHRDDIAARRGYVI